MTADTLPNHGHGMKDLSHRLSVSALELTIVMDGLLFDSVAASIRLAAKDIFPYV